MIVGALTARRSHRHRSASSFLASSSTCLLRAARRAHATPVLQRRKLRRPRVTAAPIHVSCSSSLSAAVSHDASFLVCLPACLASSAPRRRTTNIELYQACDHELRRCRQVHEVRMPQLRQAGERGGSQGWQRSCSQRRWVHLCQRQRRMRRRMLLHSKRCARYSSCSSCEATTNKASPDMVGSVQAAPSAR